MTTKLSIQPSKKILNMPAYIFAELDDWKAEARANGVDLIDLGMGNPDGATPSEIVEYAVESIRKPESHGYPTFKGKEEFRIKIAEWMKRRYDVDVCPEDEIQTLLGAKEGLAHLALAYTDPGDINIVPDPYYPVLSRGTWISSGEVHHVKLEDKNDFLPDLDSIPVDVAQKAKIFFVNYPNNPTGGVATREFYEKLVAFCKKYQIILCADLAYGEICYDGYRPLSIFNIEGAKDIAIEFHSFSKTFNMAGWRIGWACGNKEIIKNLYTIKTNVDYGTSTIVQDAAIKAITGNESNFLDIAKKYENRRNFMVEGFRELGWDVNKSKATMYMWLKVPTGHTSKEYCKWVLDTAGVVFTPGMAFGVMSDDYFRVSLVVPDEKLKQALVRLKEHNITFS